MLFCFHGHRVAAGEKNCCFAESSFGSNQIKFVEQ